MKKRLLASLLSLCLIVGLLPAAALAADESGTDGETPVVCTMDEGCEAETHDEGCPLYAAPGEPAPCALTEGCTLEAGHEGECALPDEPKAPADPAEDEETGGAAEPTIEEQLAALIAALPNPSDIDPLDEEQVEAVYNQISAIYAFAGENGLDVEDNEIINAVIAALYPVEPLADGQTISSNTTWSETKTLTGDLTVNSGVTLTIGAKVTISGDVTISGGGTIKRGNSYKDELLSVPSGAELTLQNITIDGGATWDGDTASGLTAEEAAIRITGGMVALEDGAVVQNNNHTSTKDNSYNHTTYTDGGQTYDLPRYYNMGGGIVVYAGTLTMNDGATVKNNAVTNTDYNKVSSGVERTGNSDSLGGGVAVYENGTFIMNGGEITGNRAAVSSGDGRAFGGGVGLITRGANEQVLNTPDTYKITFTMSGGTISKNSASTGGGGVYGCVDQGDDKATKRDHLVITIAGEISGNNSTQTGGGIQVGSADLNIENGASIVSNEAEITGGGIQVGSDSVFHMSNGVVSENKAATIGGGIYFNCNEGGELSITGGTVSQNTAGTAGGGIQITTGLSVSIANCMITNNACGTEGAETVANGGGIAANPGVALTLTNCSITGNTSHTGRGGGLYVGGPNNNEGGTVQFSDKMVIQNNTSSSTGPNTYFNSLTGASFYNLSEQSKIGITWNINDLDETGGIAVVSGVTADNYGCIAYEKEDNERYVLRQGENTAVLYKALYITLKENYPGHSAPYDGEKTFEVLGLAGETVNFTEVCGFTLTGYHIDRWATNRVGQEGHLWTNPHKFAQEDNAQVANAIWEPDVYNITYELNGGTAGSDAPSTHTYGTATTLVAPTREGYTFGGWYTSSDFSGSSVTSLDATIYTNDITLYARWMPNTYTISFSGGEGASGSTTQVTATYDQPATLTANRFTKDGYNFAGWDTDSNADEVIYSDGTQAKNLTGIKDGTVTLYAVWTTKAVLAPDVAAQTKTYNGAEQAFILNGDYTITYQQGGETATPKGAGTYDVMISTEETDTTAAYKNTIYGGLVITTAPLTITALDKRVSIGSAIPSLENPAEGTDYTVSGLCGSDALTTAPTLAYETAPSTGTTGTYTIKASGADAGDNYTISYQDGTLTVYSSGGSGGSSSSGNTATETVTNPDGSKTTIVTDKKTGTVTETTKNKDGSTLVVEAKTDGTVTITDTAADGVKVKTVDEPGQNVVASVTIPRSVGEATVTVPARVTPGMVAVNSETGEVVKLSVPTEDGMAVKLDGSADLILEDRSKDFTDTDNHWAEDAIDFATAHELFAGTSETTFAPDASMTRAMLMTVLARFDGQDTTGGSVWYEKGVAWAVANGVSDGSNPDVSITREQFTTMLYRYAGSPAVDGMALNEFVDSSSISGYATDAMRWAVGSGIIGGVEDGILAPQGIATRAQVATMLMRFVQNMTK